jgi:heat shock 70kDa protein 4
MKSNFKDTIVAPMRFLGLDSEYPLLRSETRFSPATSNKSEGRLTFNVNYQGTKHTLVAEQIMAAYLNKLKLIIAKNGLENKEVILSVPAYLTQTERKGYLDAARIAELNVVRLINDSTAIALDYGLFRKNDLDAEVPRNVLFIDYGHSKLGAFACSFTKSEMNVLEQ